MDYSRREFLRDAVVGLSVAAVPLLFQGTVHAQDSLPKSQRPGKSQGPGRSTEMLDARGSYSQAKADRIHNRSVEQEIKEAGKKPEEVKAQVNRRLRSLTGYGSRS